MADVTLNPTVTPTFTSPSQTQSAAQTTTPTNDPSPSYTPIWLVNDSIGSNAFEMLGMRKPNAAGDLAAMLAEISLTLEISIDESEKNKALSGLARLVSAMGAFGINAVRELIMRNDKSLEDTNKLLSDYNTAAAPLINERNTLNSSIAGYNAKIATLQGELAGLQQQYDAAPDLLKPFIALQIDSKRNEISITTSQLNQALADRKGVEIDLAELKADTLSSQLDDLKDQLKLVSSGSPEAATLSALITNVTAKLDDINHNIDQLNAETYTEASGNAHYAAVDSDFTGAFGSVTDTLGQLASDGRKTLAAVSAFVLALMARASAGLLPTSADALQEQSRQVEVEDSFGDIADELDAASQRLKTLLLNYDRTERADVDRVAEVARGLLAAVSDILEALDGLDATAPSAPPPGQTINNRLRIGI